MQKGPVSGSEGQETSLLWRLALPRSYIDFFGRRIIRFFYIIHGLVAFALITLAVLFTKTAVGRDVIRPMVFTQLIRSGWNLLPTILFLAIALGLVIIGQTVSLLTRVGANNFLGIVMVTVVVRELGPLIVALFVLARTGTANVIELGTARAMGEVEALESLGIDPIHYFVVPRVIGMSISVFALTTYLILGALISGYLWAFIQDVPLLPGEYFKQLAEALRGLDFVLLALKTFLFGILIAIVTSYYGLAQPLKIEEVSRASVQAVGQTVVACVLLDALFIVIYLIA
ncbi:MAG TPA: ABC transporter permease [Candidatus Saccharimonadales bacterium]|nr:ABC transporter permease [Candidatus Saccharimonadales bacterium]